MIFLELINNLALLALIAIFSGYFNEQCPGEKRVAALHGVLFGFACIIGMTCPVEMAPGVIYDGRSVMLSLCGLFFGPLAVTIAVAMALSCRLMQSGVGMLSGVLLIISSALIGLIFRYKQPETKHDPSAARLLVMGLTVNVFMVLLMLLLPPDIGKEVFRKITLPAIIIYPLATLLVGKVLSDHLSRTRLFKQLEDSEANLGQLVKNAPVGIFTTTHDGHFIGLNDAMARILGYDNARQVLSDNPNISTRFYEVPERRAELVKKLTEDGQIKSFEMEFVSLDQRRIWISLNARTISQGDNKPFLIEGFMIDVTARKQREMETLRNANRMSVLLRILSKPFSNVQELLDYTLEETLQLTKSKIGYIFYYNEVRRQLTLKSESTDVAKECTVVAPKIVYDLDNTGIWGEAVRQRKPIFINDFASFNPLKKGIPDGHVKIKTFLTVPIFQDDQIVATVGIANKEEAYEAEDVIQIQILFGSVWKEVARRKAEEAHTLLSGQLQQAQKMEAVGRLAGGIAHDFNNILQAMLGYSELLKEDFSKDKEASDILREVISEGRRAANLTNQLLAFASKQAINPRVLNINEAITNLLKMLKRLIGENIDLQWEPGENICLVKIDLSQLDQIMANLAVNARDAINGVGTLRVETDNAYLDEKYCAETIGTVCGNYVMLTFCDNGCGMDTEIAKHIFEPFFTTKERGKGTGLGLATVYGIVQQNGGHISVKTKPQKGTTFRIYLPAYFDDENIEIQKVRKVEVPPVGTETVMVVDDEEPMLRSIQLIMQSLGYKVLSALGSERAAAVSQAYDGEINLLLTDVVMPKHSGRDLHKIILAQRPDIKCIYMSGYTADIIANHGVLEEGLNFIQKPFSRIDLAVKIREVLSQK